MNGSVARVYLYCAKNSKEASEAGIMVMIKRTVGMELERHGVEGVINVRSRGSIRPYKVL